MSGNGSRTRSRDYGTKGVLLPTPRPCSGLRSSGINQTEIMMSLERMDSGVSHSMTTSKPSQPPLFDGGSESANAATMFPTPKVSMDHGSPSELRRNTPSLAAQINHNLHSLPPAIPASHSLSPGSAWARKMTGISGRSLRHWLPTSRLAGVFSRMCMDTSRWGSTRCYLTWKRSATPAGRSLFRLVPSAPPTGGIASGFWPTPNAIDPTAGSILNENTRIIRTPTGNLRKLSNSGGDFGLGLARAVAMFPTPRASENENRQTKPTPSQLAGKHGRLLAAEVGMMPTPTSTVNTDALTMLTEEPPFVRGSYDLKPGEGWIDEFGILYTAPEPTRLSAAWVTRLMGYPDSWLDLPED